MKRSYDTAIVTYELITSGLNATSSACSTMPTGTSPATCTTSSASSSPLLVVPIRLARAYAWRAPPPAAETAAARFHRELGARMNITNFPPTFQSAEKYFDDYERDNIAYSPAGVELMASTVQVLKSRLPAPASPLTKQMLSAMFDDDRFTDALDLPRATALSNATSCEWTALVTGQGEPSYFVTNSGGRHG